MRYYGLRDTWTPNIGTFSHFDSGFYTRPITGQRLSLTNGNCPHCVESSRSSRGTRRYTKAAVIRARSEVACVFTESQHGLLRSQLNLPYYWSHIGLLRLLCFPVWFIFHRRTTSRKTGIVERWIYSTILFMNSTTLLSGRDLNS